MEIPTTSVQWPVAKGRISIYFVCKPLQKLCNSHELPVNSKMNNLMIHNRKLRNISWFPLYILWLLTIDKDGWWWSREGIPSMKNSPDFLFELSLVSRSVIFNIILNTRFFVPGNYDKALLEQFLFFNPRVGHCH